MGIHVTALPLKSLFREKTFRVKSAQIDNFMKMMNQFGISDVTNTINNSCTENMRKEKDYLGHCKQKWSFLLKVFQ